MKRKLLLVMCASIALHSFAQKNFWKPISEYQAIKMNKGHQFFDANGFVPAVYKFFQLDENAIRQIIKQAPMESYNAFSQSNAIIPVPLMNGKVEMFRIAEAPVMMPKLQAKYPDIHSYAGQSIDNPAHTIRFDISPLGLHATVSDVDGKKIYINPINKDEGLYLINERNENDKAPGGFVCSTEGAALKGNEVLNKTAFVGNADDGKLHTYRLALCVTGKWSQGIMTGTEVTTQDSINTVMSAINGYLVRANEVYERDLSIRLVFVDNEDTLIFLDPNTDPFTTSLNSQCQSTCDKRIGNANYDIGHVIDKASNNGNAGCINCVCSSGVKGSGYTQYSNVNTAQLVDYFIIDYWTHEMGHQVGANHTFTHSSEGTNAQTEPGSGSTIMGYAGITGNTDVQAHSDDLFSCASIAQISNSWKNKLQGGHCAVVSSAGNKVPVANGGKDYTIPAKTPFLLTGVASDTNKTDVLSYIWEQTDVLENPGSSTIPKGKNTKGPMFRTYNYSTSASRYFPQLSDILLGKDSTKWEVLPSVTRDLNFRFTVRDNHPGGGSNKSDDVLIKVDGNSGPFKILYPATAISKKAGDTLNIKWSVANTNLAPVNCQNVSVGLSTDGGQNFTVLLIRSTANDGSVTVTIPNKATTQARIAVKALGNVFFAVNKSNFTITSSAATASGNIAAVAGNSNSKNIFSIKSNPATDKTTLVFNGNFADVKISVTDATGRQVYKNNLANAQSDQQLDISVNQFTPGLYFVKVNAGNEMSTQKLIVE